MADPSRSDPRLNEERLLHALVSRGLLTREEAKAGRAGPGGESGAEALLARLTAAGALTAAQAGRRNRS